MNVQSPLRVLLFLAFLPFSIASFALAEPWQAGAAKVKITPGKLMWMSGYGARKEPAQGTRSELWAKALVLQDPQGNRLALVGLDLVGIGRETSLAVRSELAKQHGLAIEQVAIFCSHTHCGPVVGRNLGAMYFLEDAQWQLVDEYEAILKQKLVEVVGEAMSKRVPANLAWGTGHATFAVNRRTNREPEVPMLREQGMLKGPVDHDVPVLSVRDSAGSVMAVAFGYACHATVLSFQEWCADYPGYAQTELEKLHPEAVALFFAGCGADQNPLPRRTVEVAQDYGRRLASAVEDVLTAPMNAMEGELKASYAEIPLAFDALPTGEQLQTNAKSTNRYEAQRAKLLLAQLDAGRPLSPTYPFPVQVWRLGPHLQWITLGGEVVVDYSLRLKLELGREHTWVAGYANDVMAYIPSRRVLLEGGYEGGGAMVYYGLPTVWSPQVEETIVREVSRQAGK